MYIYAFILRQMFQHFIKKNVENLKYGKRVLEM